jgi:SAM-dependent methyltransferase/uncharacterized protein YbaR (Trm112 family)
MTLYVQLCCPKDGTLLTTSTDSLICTQGHKYPVIDGVPVLLRDDVPQTIGLAYSSLARAERASAPNAFQGRPQRDDDLHLDTLGISESERSIASTLAQGGATGIDPAVSVLVAATGGLAYKSLVGRDFNYPIPRIRLPDGNGDTLLDIGCSWGRWSIAAARQGYNVVGVDPSLGALTAAKRVADRLGLRIQYVCADARYLPFASETFAKVFSYSVIQHFSKSNANIVFTEIARVLLPRGSCLVQMASRHGLRSLVHLTKRRFSEGTDFEVRYWGLKELRQTVERLIGPSEISAHCYFGLGLETADAALVSRRVRWLLSISDWLRVHSETRGWLVRLADSVYVAAVKSVR